MPAAIWPGSKAPQLEGIGLSELQSPAPYRLVRNIDTTFSQHIFNIAKAEWEPETQPDGALDYLCRKPMSAVADLVHNRKLLATRS
jgi:hypothetical protein